MFINKLSIPSHFPSNSAVKAVLRPKMTQINLKMTVAKPNDTNQISVIQVLSRHNAGLLVPTVNGSRPFQDRLVFQSVWAMIGRIGCQRLTHYFSYPGRL